MAWTPPSKFIVVLTFLMWAGGLFLLVDLTWSLTGLAYPVIAIGGLSSGEVWFIIGLGLLGLAWLLMFLAVKLKGL